MIEMTNELEQKLENLKNCFCLRTDITRLDFNPYVNNSEPYVFLGWEEETKIKKSLFGKSKAVRHITKLWIKKAEHVDTPYLGVFEENLAYIVSMIEQDRKNFISMRKALRKLGYVIEKRLEI